VPAADRVVIAQHLAAIAQRVQLVGRLADAIDANDGTMVRSIETQGNQAKASANGLAPGYGFKVCGRA
jgi:hypothetical protein